jgi:hypothetical protein
MIAPLHNRFTVALADALSATLNESDWRRFAALHGLTKEIEEHPRFLRSLSWGDPDYAGHVLSLVQELFDREDHEAVDALFLMPVVQSWLKRNEKELLTEWNASNADDPLVEGISESLEEIHTLADAVDLGHYTKRIRSAIPDDLPLALGATKELLEAVMRTVLERRGFDSVEYLDFPALTNRCFLELGLSGITEPTNAHERLIRKSASKARQVIESINELRNEAGTGHGKAAGKEPTVAVEDANMIAALGMVLAAWLIRKA